MRIFGAVDIGGTMIKYGVVSETGAVLYCAAVPTQAEEGGFALTEKVGNIVRSMLRDSPELDGIGISTAGIVDTREGTVIYANDNLPGYGGTAWKRILESQFKLRVDVNNDVNAAALAESWIGAAKGFDNFFCLTVGTGVGGAAFLNGRLYTGPHFRAAEIGYMRTEGNGKERFESSASVTALVRTARACAGEEGLDCPSVFRRARAGDPICAGVLSAWFDSLAKGVVNAICLFDPELIVVGGGISNEGEYLIGHLREHVLNYLSEELVEGIKFRPAAYRNQAGIIGAVCDLARAVRNN